MTLADLNIVQILAYLAGLFISGSGFWWFIRWSVSKPERNVAIDERVALGYKRYADKLEKRLDVERVAHEAEIARKDAIIFEQEQMITKQRHDLRNAETAVVAVQEAKVIETETAKTELHDAVDTTLSKIIP